MTRSFPTSGAVSARVSVLGDRKSATNYVDLYRSEIARGTNRCEPRGRPALLERRVRVNEYIDYHDPNVGGLSSTLEDFHFGYPVDPNRCVQTNDPSTVRAFQFNDVTRTQNDTFIARTFPIAGSAFAVTHDFSIFRSELHYRASVDTAGTCVGFVVPLAGYQQANFVINEIGFGALPSPKWWLIQSLTICWQSTMAFDLSKLSLGVERFLQAWRVVRICPDRIDAPKEQLSFNILTLGITLVIFVLARSTISGADQSIATDTVATVISSFVVFLTGFVTLFLDPNGGMERAYKWGTFFVLTWITSLICAILIDGISIWNSPTHKPLSSVIINEIFVQGSLPAFVKNLLRAIGFGVIALALLIIKTKIMDPPFKMFSKCAIITLATGLTMNTVLLVLFLYSNIL